ncbi:MAG: YSIRK-type signal peptide-containing protein [Streptococcus salivarius]
MRKAYVVKERQRYSIRKYSFGYISLYWCKFDACGHA